MSDLAQININVVYDNTPMDKMIKSGDAAEAMVKRLNQAYKDSKITMDEAMRGLQEIEVYQKKNSVAIQDTIRLEKESIRVAKESAAIKSASIKEISSRAETAFSLSMQKIREEESAKTKQIEVLRNRAETAFALTMQRLKEEGQQKAILAKAADAEIANYVKTTLAAEKAAAAKAVAFQKSIGGALGLGSANASANGAGTGQAFVIQALKEEEAERKLLALATKQEADQLEYLNMKYDKAYAAAKLYKTVQDEINLAMSKGVGNAGQLKVQLDKLQAEYAAFGAGTADVTNRFVQQAYAVEESRKGVNRFGLLVQQTGYQAGDFLVQIQSGTNAFVAFGQQATQLVGILPMFATELGVSAIALGGITLGLSIAIPLLTALGAYFMRTSESANKSAGEVDVFAEAIKNLTSEIQKNQETFLKIKFNTDIFGIASAKQQIEDLEKGIESTKKTIESLNVGLSLPGGQAVLLRQMFMESDQEAAQKKLDLLESQLQKLKDQQEAQRMLNGGLSVASGLHRAAIMSKQEELRIIRETKQYIAEQLLIYLNIGKAVSDISKLDIKAVFQDAVSPSSAMYQFVQKTYDTMSKMVSMTSAAQRTDYYKLGTLNAGMVGRAGGKGQGEAVNYSFIPTTTTSTTETSGGGIKTNPLAELQKQIALQEELNGKTEAEKKVREALGDSWSKYSPAVIQGLEDQIQKQIELEDRLEGQQEIWDTVKNSMSDAFIGMVDGTKSAKDAFKSMAAAIIKELYNVLVVQQMVGSFNASTGVGSGIVGMISGAIAGKRADGGPVSAGLPYLVGERGPELIIPKSHGTVLTNPQTKSALGGNGSSETFVVHNNINITGSDSVMVRQEIAKALPQITSATKAAMIDAKRRGGQMAAAFA